MEKPLIQRRPEIVHGAAKSTAGVFERRRKTRTGRGTDRRTVGPVVAEARNERVRVEIRKPSAALRRNERLILLRLHRAEVILSRLVDGAGLRMVDTEIQPHAVPDLEGI